MIKMEFAYNKKITNIQSNLNDKFESIFKKFLKKNKNKIKRFKIYIS